MHWRSKSNNCGGKENSLTWKQKWLQPMLGWQYCNLVMWKIPAQDQKMECHLTWKHTQGKNYSGSIINPVANECQPGLQKSTQQSLKHPNKPLDVRSKERGPCFKAAFKHWYNMHDHQEGGGNHALCTNKITAVWCNRKPQDLCHQERFLRTFFLATLFFLWKCYVSHCQQLGAGV